MSTYIVLYIRKEVVYYMYREGIIIVMMAAKSGTRKFLATDQNVPGGIVH